MSRTYTHVLVRHKNDSGSRRGGNGGRSWARGHPSSRMPEEGQALWNEAARIEALAESYADRGLHRQASQLYAQVYPILAEIRRRGFLVVGDA